ncbi:MAG: substrate-binding domain-containing protein [Coriobacteriia bacterium]|jgi:putative molybdopterin biosynthesis protein|nr:substrate-binding domain-containing protein [Coriobacteriia bacterium]
MAAAHTIERLDALRAVGDPHRLQMLRLLLSGPMTISMIGSRLDRHPAWVRHHVKVLEAAGLAHLAEVRTTRNFTEKFYTATAAAFTISMSIRAEAAPGSPLVAMVSHDIAVEMLAAECAGCSPMAVLVAGSLDSLIGVRQGLADIAGCHLLDAESGQYNAPYARHIFPDREMVLVTLAHREQGLITAPGNPHRIMNVDDLAEGGLRVANRKRGSGTRLWLDHALASRSADVRAIVGYDSALATHTEVAEAVAHGIADVGLGIAAVAERYGLGFVPLFRERYDLVMPSDIYEREETHRLLERLNTAAFKHAVSTIPGYESAGMGDEIRLAV